MMHLMLKVVAFHGIVIFFQHFIGNKTSTGPIHIPQVGKSRTLYFAQEMEVQLQLADHAPSA